jgi:hypothetical protein
MWPEIKLPEKLGHCEQHERGGGEEMGTQKGRI